MLTVKEVKAIYTLIDDLTHKEGQATGGLAKHIWESIETLRRLLQHTGLSQHLKPDVSAPQMRSESKELDFFITPKAQMALGAELEMFLSQSLQIIEGFYQSLFKECRRGRLRQEELESRVYSRMDENGVVLLMDCVYRFFLVALESELADL